jgi:hypothetical protein
LAGGAPYFVNKATISLSGGNQQENFDSFRFIFSWKSVVTVGIGSMEFLR